MQQKVSPPMIIGAVVLLVAVMFGLYKFTLGSSSGPAPKAEDRPAYTKGGSAAAAYGQGYAEAAKHRPPGAGMGRPSYGGPSGGGSGYGGGGGYGSPNSGYGAPRTSGGQ